jgi:6-phosphofructokinase
LSNLLIIHGGGPTAVLNASLHGVIQATYEVGSHKLWGAIGGTGGVLKQHFIDLSNLSQDQIGGLLTTPGSVIGSSRDELSDADYAEILHVLRRRKISAVLVNGGNGSMDAAAKLWRICRSAGIRVMGIPKTMDNDIPITDHSPGYGSAARYIASSVAELAVDVRGLPAHLVIVESLGRDTGWAAAAAALAADSGFGPDRIYLPEIPFEESSFLRDCETLMKEKGHGVVVVSEGLKKPDGSPIVSPTFQRGRITYHGDVGAHLANLIIRDLGYRVRNERPGLLMRCGMAHVSAIDREEAIMAGQFACHQILKGESGHMVAFRRLPGSRYQIEPFLLPLEKLAFGKKPVPRSFINETGNHVTADFCEWSRPLIGAPLQRFIRLV